MTSGDKLVIYDETSLRMWGQQLRETLLPRSLPAVRFEFAALSAVQNAAFSNMAQRYKDSCGCASSGFLMSTVTLWNVASYLSASNRWSSYYLQEIGYCLSTAVLAAVIGKILGLSFARWKLFRLATLLQSAINRPQHSVYGSAIV